MPKKILSLLIPLLFLASCASAPSGAVILTEVPLNDTRTEVLLPPGIQASILDLTEEITPDYFSASEKANPIFSPVSLWYALGILREGAAGETLKDLDGLMKLEDGFDPSKTVPDLSRALNFMEKSGLKDVSAPGGIRLSNGLFIDEVHRSALKEDYLERTAGVWGTETAAVDFTDGPGTKEIIRKWVSAKTDDFIPDYEALFKEDGSAILNIYNVLYLQDHWQQPFHRQDDQIFHAPDRDVTVPFMGRMKYPDAYIRKEGYEAAAFQGEKGIRLWYLLPDSGSPLDLIGEIRTILTEGTGGEFPMLNFMAPVLDVEGENLSMKPILTEKGYGRMFENADLEKMLPGKDTQVGDIRQKTRLQVDEKGFKAAAVTEILVEGTSAPESRDFILDRPFLLVIEYESLPLFVSHISDPDEK